jgi:ketosteroid isomerase-like protein
LWYASATNRRKQITKSNRQQKSGDTTMGNVGFDFAGQKRAYEEKDVSALVAFFADDVEWIEYKNSAPPRLPHRMTDKETIRKFVQGVADADVKLQVSDEVIGDGRIAFCITCILADDRRGIEHVIIHLRDGKIVRQVDVEAWD